jgi:hypothetical protein
MEGEGGRREKRQEGEAEKRERRERILISTTAFRLEDVLNHPALVLYRNKVRLSYPGKCYYDLDPVGVDCV